MAANRRVYLDNAATSWPKPDGVYQAVDRYQRELGAPAGRGTYAEAVEVARLLERTRRSALELVNGAADYAAVFTANCTAALNQAIHGLLRPGDHVVTTVAEHNSVLRPLRLQQEQRGVDVTYVRCDQHGRIDPRAIRLALRPATRLVAVTHASNVTGAVQPIEAIAEVVRDHDARLLIDAAQTLGHWPLDLARVPADYIAAAGHKGPLGPLGAGLLYVRRDAARDLVPLMQGGTGSQSESDAQPAELPDRFESGNLNLPAIVGLEAGLAYVRGQGVDKLAAHARDLTGRLLAGLARLPGVTAYGPQDVEQRVGVVSFNLEGYDPQEIAAGLESVARIQVRAGLHCAGRMHEQLGTLSLGGTVRVSFGPFNTQADVELLLETLRQFTATS